MDQTGNVRSYASNKEANGVALQNCFQCQQQQQSVDHSFLLSVSNAFHEILEHLGKLGLSQALP
eukprot:1159184-Pelagomonas_calceolata.AAC.3